MCLLYGSQNKQQILPYRTLKDWFLQPWWSVFTARYASLYITQIRLVFTRFGPVGYLVHNQRKIKTSYVLPTHTVFVCSARISEQTAIGSLHSIQWCVFITEAECVYCAVRTESLNIIKVNPSPQGINSRSNSWPSPVISNHTCLSLLSCKK
jgi:hypothetical protein